MKAASPAKGGWALNQKSIQGKYQRKITRVSMKLLTAKAAKNTQRTQRFGNAKVNVAFFPKFVAFFAVKKYYVIYKYNSEILMRGRKMYNECRIKWLQKRIDELKAATA